ncbi:hypothetical protein RIMD111065_19270 [Aeromonas hydrophila]|nr:hypothetical protein [Aeromonas hydrophila]BCO13571.1 hypothetical protein RIMD111065_19270 [Aeromonas hydrophila]
MYENTETVLSDIKKHLELKFSTGDLNLNNEFRFSNLYNENFHFVIDACFIQCRTEHDFLIPIENRVDDAIGEVCIEAGKKYKFTIENGTETLPEYTVIEV